MEIMNIKLYDLKEVSEILNVTERTVLTYLYDGKLKGQKIKRKWRVSEQNLKNFLNGE